MRVKLSCQVFHDDSVDLSESRRQSQPQSRSRPRVQPVLSWGEPQDQHRPNDRSADRDAVCFICRALLQTFLDQYHLKLHVLPFTGSDSSVSFDSLDDDDLTVLVDFGKLLICEYAKYSEQWVNSSRLASIALVKNLKTNATDKPCSPSGFCKSCDADHIPQRGMHYRLSRSAQHSAPEALVSSRVLASHGVFR
jgi:hypothetical protein